MHRLIGSTWGTTERGSVVRDRSIDIDQLLSRAIAREIGEKFREILKEEPEIPPSFRTRIDRLRELERLPSNPSGRSTTRTGR